MGNSCVFGIFMCKHRMFKYQNISNGELQQFKTWYMFSFMMFWQFQQAQMQDIDT